MKSPVAQNECAFWTLFQSVLDSIEANNLGAARRELESIRKLPDVPLEVFHNYEQLLELRASTINVIVKNSGSTPKVASKYDKRQLNPGFLDLNEVFEHAQRVFDGGDHMSSLVLWEHMTEMKKQWRSIRAFVKWIGTWLGMKSELHKFQHARNRALEHVCNSTGLEPVLNTAKTTSRGKTLRFLHTLISTGYPTEKLSRCVDNLAVAKDRFALRANLAAGKDMREWEASVNGLYAEYGLRGLSLKGTGFASNVMDQIVFLEVAEKPEDRGLVTICISAHNSAATLSYAIESILRQDYQNFELLVIDDASTDSTAEVAKSYAARDSRVVPILNERNRGTYWNRNLALSRAKGEYFTVLDADDICHPERIPLQLEVLDQNSDVMGVFGLWFRLEPNGRMTYRNSWGGVIVHEAVATLLFRRKAVISRIGYYDPVKIASDTEYMERIKRVFGSESVKLLHLPLSIALAHTNSLTAAQGTGIENYFGLSKPRKDYRNSWSQWHITTSPEQLFIPLAKADYVRPFPAPEEILVPLD